MKLSMTLRIASGVAGVVLALHTLVSVLGMARQYGHTWGPDASGLVNFFLGLPTCVVVMLAGVVAAILIGWASNDYKGL